MTANRKGTVPNRPAVERGFLHSALGVAARSNDGCHVSKAKSRELWVRLKTRAAANLYALKARCDKRLPEHRRMSKV